MDGEPVGIRAAALVEDTSAGLGARGDVGSIMLRVRLLVSGTTILRSGPPRGLLPKTRGPPQSRLRHTATSVLGRASLTARSANGFADRDPFELSIRVFTTIVIAAVGAYFLVVMIVALHWFSPDIGRRAIVSKPGSKRTFEGGATTPPPRSTPVMGISFAVVMLAALPMLAAALRWWHPFDGYDHTVSHHVNNQVASLLAGEQLVPPQPLPPALFATPDVESARPLAATASREWALLEPEFRQRLLMVMQIMRDRHGIDMVLLEGFRSEARQAQLAAVQPPITLAAAGASWHQMGLAADCAFVFDGRIVISEKDPRAARAYALYGDVAQSLGLMWGGTWRNLVDLGHVELRRAPLRPRVTSATLAS